MAVMWASGKDGAEEDEFHAIAAADDEEAAGGSGHEIGFPGEVFGDGVGAIGGQIQLGEDGLGALQGLAGELGLGRFEAGDLGGRADGAGAKLFHNRRAGGGVHGFVGAAGKGVALQVGLHGRVRNAHFKTAGWVGGHSGHWSYYMQRMWGVCAGVPG